MGAQRNSPSSYRKSSSPMQRLKSTTLKYLFDLDSRENSVTSKPPALATSELDEILSLISYCSYIHNPTDPLEYSLQQNLKCTKLSKLLSIVKSLRKPFPCKILPTLFDMILANLLRPLPPPTGGGSTAGICPEDDDIVANPEPAWPHLQIVYDILVRTVMTVEPRVLSSYIDGAFVLNLLSLFESEDLRERECVKNLYHKIYSKFHALRSFMRRAMNDVLLCYVFETEQRHCGIGDLRWHWSRSVRQLTENVKEMLEEMEPSLYANCLSKVHLRDEEEEEIRRKREVGENENGRIR